MKAEQYITDSKFTNDDKCVLFKLRTRMCDVKANFKNNYSDELSCRMCHSEVETQQHLLDCEVMINNCKDLYNDTVVEYNDLFGETSRQLRAVRLFSKVLKTRKQMIDSEEENAT